jgi:hypothetical protein
MKSSSIGEFLFGYPERPISRAERIQIIRDRVRDEKYLTTERLDRAIEKMLEEIRQS